MIIKIGNIEMEMELIETNAPVEYDAFGSLTIYECDNGRQVLVMKEHTDWHLGRYASGGYYGTRVDLSGSMLSWASQKLYEAMQRGLK